MSVTPTDFVDATLTGTLTTELWAGSASQAIITNVTLCNTSASAVAVTLKLGAKALYSGNSMAPNSTWTLGPNDIRKVIAAGGKITGGAATGSVVDVTVSGVVIS
jgi:hypothetical protein